jgi:hypothetical protein
LNGNQFNSATDAEVNASIIHRLRVISPFQFARVNRLPASRDPQGPEERTALAVYIQSHLLLEQDHIRGLSSGSGNSSVQLDFFPQTGYGCLMVGWGPLRRAFARSWMDCNFYGLVNGGPDHWDHRFLQNKFLTVD